MIGSISTVVGDLVTAIASYRWCMKYLALLAVCLSANIYGHHQIHILNYNQFSVLRANTCQFFTFTFKIFKTFKVFKSS
jgi:hypothetical protein